MINLSDFQPLSIAKIKKVSSTTGFLLKIFSDKVHAILIEEITVQTTLPDGASVRRPSRIIAGEPERGSCLFFIIGPEKKAKSVGCKIGDLRSKFAFNIRGLLNVETCAVDYGCL